MKAILYSYSRSLCLWVLLLGFVGSLHAQVKNVDRKVTGRGKTPEEAAINGLIEAINQVKGVKVDALKDISSSFREVYSEVKGEKPTTELVDDNRLKQKVVLSSKGYVKSYTVNNTRKIPDGRWEASLTVVVPEYFSPGQDKSDLRRMAITLFRAAKPQFAFGSGQMSAADVSRRLNQKLVSQMTQARKFRVLDQQFDLEIGKQFDRLKDGKARPEELARAGRKLGADYVLVGTINSFNLKQQVVKPGFGLPDEILNTANVIVEFRVIEVATQQTMWSNELNLLFDNNELARLVPRLDADQLPQALLGRAADEIVNEILDVIYPIKVAHVDGENAILNQGGKRVKLGTYYKVEGEAKWIVDPDTGLKFKLGGSNTSTIVITEVMPKYSRAKIVEGNKDLKVGQVCRRTQVKIVAAPPSGEK